eukprot:jgi/Undpi1/6461/HiC_scaffold_20.g08940.m1
MKEQDSRWGDAEKKLLRRTKFSKVLEQKVNMKKVNMDVMQRWIAQRITSLLGFEDDIVVGTCVNYLAEEGKLNPKKLQLQLTGFLEKSTGMFMEELWGLLVDAQTSLGGIPSAFLQDKKQEMIQAKEEESQKEEEIQRRMAEHQQEMERAALLLKTQAEASAASAASDAGSGSTSETLPRRKTTDGRRASRWGVSQADVAATSVAGVETENNDAPTAAEAENALLGLLKASASSSGPNPVGHEVDDASRQDSRGGDMRERSSSDRSESPEKSRKHSKSGRDDKDEDGRKERKRKSKSKHSKKSDRKKRKSVRRSEDREHRRSSKKGDERGTSADGSGDEGSSSEDDEGAKSKVEVEEALRLKVMAAVASKKERQTQDDR